MPSKFSNARTQRVPVVSQTRAFRLGQTVVGTVVFREAPREERPKTRPPLGGIASISEVIHYISGGAAGFPRCDGAPTFSDGKPFHEGCLTICATVGLEHRQQSTLAFGVIRGRPGETPGVAALPIRP